MFLSFLISLHKYLYYNSNTRDILPPVISYERKIPYKIGPRPPIL
jgi:hypothetical protein